LNQDRRKEPPNKPLELTAHSAGFLGYSRCFPLWAAAHRQRSASEGRYPATSHARDQQEETIMGRSMVRCIVTFTLSLCMVSLAAAAQPAGQVSRIGLLIPGSSSHFSSRIEVFRQGLRDLGYVEGQHLALEYRYAENLDRIPDLAADLVRLPVALILAGATPSARAAQHATTTIPIVFVDVTNPVERGLVASLARPGGNITGMGSEEGHPEGGAGLTAKQLELLKDAVPTVSRVAMLFGQVGVPIREANEQARERAARVLGLTLRHFYVQRPEECTAWVFSAITADAQAINALYVRGPFTLESRQQLADFALQHRLPLMAESKEFAEAGSLLAYGASRPAMWRRAAHYVERILKGTPPADLPVEQPMTFELVINLKTAKALGITIPPTLLFLADEVIQ
jgi:putative tryptophan/tyrosine transport system substrate-binding protein